MATRFYTKPPYESIRVNRGDGSYIVFEKGIADVFDPHDEYILSQYAFITRGSELKDIPVGQRSPNYDTGALSWYSPLLGVADGYGNSAEKMILALEKSGKRVSLEHGWQLSAPETLIREIMDRPHVYGDVRLAYSPPHASYWRRHFPDQAVIGFTMWEDDRIPDCWTPIFPAVHVVATCSKFNVSMFQKHFEEYGIKSAVAYVPLGVAHELYPYKRRSYRPGEQPFVFLHTSTGMSDARKGAHEAYQAFRSAFTDGENVKLIFRARQGHIDVGNDPRVEFRTGVITEAEKLEILYEAHCFVYPSFGEGFGLMPLEAIASGLPAIVSRNSAMLDYADLYYGVDCDPEPSLISVPWQTKSLGCWQRPRHTELVAQMRKIYGDYQLATSFAAKSAKKVRAQWGYDKSAAALLVAIDMARGLRETQLAA